VTRQSPQIASEGIFCIVHDLAPTSRPRDHRRQPFVG
jgi:hypothetical protein